ncbi:hypothetical protein Asphe3_06470 [Pseudarthrobacter phenanthrenivorans Sphe3]|uniref:Uncharacterized protein n=1 Tax=Pseudarthrobacter phenanthrenivorans (strain DSM 18606 / JCM 16027 / LMG 23796 / Sphe3) TaxID=930171 RepID=F0MBH4_PSEPM|nr:hypothetical protein Asphe3_06470 [Pseudarthrobacter phenanthrenivorans Sphe3]
MMKELTMQELEAQGVELLPSRETLFLDCQRPLGIAHRWPVFLPAGGQ